MARKARRLELAAQHNGSPAPRRTLSLSAARRAQLKLQGEYMGTMRQLSAADKKKVRAIKEKRGHRAAIEAARALRRKRSR